MFYYIKFYNYVIILVLLFHIISEMLPPLRKNLLLVALVLSMAGNLSVLRRKYFNGNYTNFNKFFKYFQTLLGGKLIKWNACVIIP
jgi:hypothetical protein